MQTYKKPKYKKRKLLRVTAIIICLSILAACLSTPKSSRHEQTTYFKHASEKERLFVDQILGSMSIEQKVGQMIQAEINSITPQEVRRYAIGSVLNGGGSFPYKDKYASAIDWVSLASELHAHSPKLTIDGNSTLIPILWGTDAIHGHNNLFDTTIFPHNIGLGAANDETLVKEVFSATAKDVQRTGIKWAFAPTVAVARNAHWGRTYESFSENSEHVARLSAAAVKGLQGDNIRDLPLAGKVIATAKHFIGDGGTLNGKDQGNVLLSEAELLSIHGLSFERAIDAGVQTVMVSFNSWNSEKVHGSQYLLQSLLKGKMQFNGFVIGDWNGHAQINGCSKIACAQAINAGIDMLMVPKDWRLLLENTIEQVKQGIISEERIEDAVRRILSVKYRAGLFDDRFFNNNDNYNKALVTKNAIESSSKNHSEQHRNLARKAVRKSLVLLKNNENTLPCLLYTSDAADE